MNILVLNGSPKGKYSITLQTGKYLELLYPEHKFEVIHAGQIIKKLQRDFTPAKEMLEAAVFVIFSYPVSFKTAIESSRPFAPPVHGSSAPDTNRIGR